MFRVKNIEVRNFKAFQENEEFDLSPKGKNVLVYGSNGSGKSSLFWALYTFLQSSIKVDEDVQKYFKNYIAADDRTHQSLKNVFMGDEEDSYIKLTAINIEDETEKEFTISHELIDTNNDTTISELNIASDFINYKLLHNFYRGSHRHEINLWAVFERDILPYFVDDANRPMLDKWYEFFDGENRVDGRAVGTETHRRTILEQRIVDYNNELTAFLSEVEANANDFLKDHFFEGEQLIKISLEFSERFTFEKIRNKDWKDEEWRRRNLRIRLRIETLKDDGSYHTIERPQSFLNEAHLTRIAIAIRIGALRTRPLAEARFKILVLDDMLISLDLSNRMDVVRIILNKENKESLKFFDGFQKFIFTHDKGFFNLIRRNTDEEEWKYYNFTKDELNNSSPTVKEDENNLQRAIRYFEEDEFENCGNELRRGAEEILSSYLDPEMKRVGKDFESLTKKLDKAYKILINRRLMKFKNRFLIDLDIEKIQKINGDIDSDPELNDQKRLYLININEDCLNS